MNEELKNDLIANYNSNAQYFADKYNVSIGRIHVLASKLKVTYKHRLIRDTNAIIKDYNAGMGIKHIKKKYGHDSLTIRNLLEGNGVILKTKSEWNKRYDMDDNYFKKIDTHEKAYWLGFLYADGNLHQEGLQMGLNEKDKDHLQTFLNCLKSDHPLYKDRDCYRFFIKRRELYQDMLKLGLSERKSLVLCPPSLDVISEKFIPSFILGFFDGDGSISINNNKKTWGVSIISTLEVCGWIRNQLRVVGLNGDGCLLQETRRGDKNVWYISYGGGFKTERGQLFVKKLYDFLYKNSSVSLKRKRDKFIECTTYPARKKTVVDKAYRQKAWVKHYAKNKEKLLAKRKNKQ